MHADKISSSLRLRDMARKVEVASEGSVHFSYATQPSSTTFYVFSSDPAHYPPHERMTESEAYTWLAGVYAGLIEHHP